MSQLVLSLFPGLGLFDWAFESAQFCVVRGPDLILGTDIKSFHPPRGRFDGVIGGPPCQAFSNLVHLVRHVHGEEAVAENLIPEFERVVLAARPRWFVMENVSAAPDPKITGYHVQSVVVNNRWFGGVQNRERRFAFGSAYKFMPQKFVTALLNLRQKEPKEFEPAVCCSNGGRPSKKNRLSTAKAYPKRSRAKEMELQGVDPKRVAGLPFSAKGLKKAVGNGVPLFMGRAVAAAVVAATQFIEGGRDEGPGTR